MKLIDKAAVIAEIERRIKTNKECMLGLRNLDYYKGKVDALNDTISFLNTLEVKEVDDSKLPNPRFPHLDNIVDKVFGAGNLEAFEYEEAEQLVLLAKEELLKDLEVEEVDLDNELNFVRDAYYYFTSDERSSMKKVARHFFELGLKVKKGE